jgi:hypothetical protein
VALLPFQDECVQVEVRAAATAAAAAAAAVIALNLRGLCYAVKKIGLQDHRAVGRGSVSERPQR